MNRLAAAVGILGLLAAFGAGRLVAPIWVVERSEVQVGRDAGGLFTIDGKGQRQGVAPVAAEDSGLWDRVGRPSQAEPAKTAEFVESGGAIYRVTAARHWGAWSLLPAALAVALCFLTREPVLALGAGIVAGALLATRYDVVGQVMIPSIGTATGATILILYLWFLGGLLGIWNRSGAALAFANAVSERFARSARSAKCVAWALGAAIFQGGTLSTVLVGTTVRPVAERQRVSREELSYIVDSTASPIAVLLPFNAWPIYVQPFLFLAGVPFLATETQRIGFFFQCIPLYFYAILAVSFTLLSCFGIFPPFGGGLRRASQRAAETGALDAPGAEPMLSPELSVAEPAPGYRPSALEFAVPVALIVGISVATFFAMGTPQVLWGFGAALVVAGATCLLRGMCLADLMGGFQSGLKGVVYGSVVLLLAVVVGGVSRETGGGLYLLGLLGGTIWPPALPVLLGLLAMVIAFSTGTSWGTFAVALPLAMPLAWGVAEAAGLDNPGLYLAVCFASVINGSLFGDQSSPISDTTVLSSLATGCDLMDHVRTQIGPCLFAAACALLGLAVVAAFC